MLLFRVKGPPGPLTVSGARMMEKVFPSAPAPVKVSVWVVKVFLDAWTPRAKKSPRKLGARLTGSHQAGAHGSHIPPPAHENAEDAGTACSASTRLMDGATGS